ncbi:anti-sigma factor domain-containing protein [Cytobacillus sp. Hm23]
MKKGVIMEISSKFVTVLTDDGEFLRTNKLLEQQYDIGQEIIFLPFREGKRSYSFLLKITRIEKWKLALVSTIAALLVFISILPFYTPNKVFAYMSIDINPSIELSINNKLEVLSVTALNTEGERIIENLPDWEKQDITFVTNSIIDESKKNGYLIEGSNLLITTVQIHQESTTKDVEKKLEEKIVIISETLEKDTIHVTSVKSDENTRKKAEEQGISTGKYLIEEAENRDKDHKEGEGAKTSSSNLKNENIIKLENQRDNLEKKESKDKKDKRDHENKKDKKDKRDHENKKDKKEKWDHENKKDKVDKRDHENKKEKWDHESKKDKED